MYDRSNSENKKFYHRINITVRYSFENWFYAQTTVQFFCKTKLSIKFNNFREYNSKYSIKINSDPMFYTIVDRQKGRRGIGIIEGNRQHSLRERGRKVLAKARRTCEHIAMINNWNHSRPSLSSDLTSVSSAVDTHPVEKRHFESGKSAIRVALMHSLDAGGE